MVRIELGKVEKELERFGKCQSGEQRNGSFWACFRKDFGMPREVLHQMLAVLEASKPSSYDLQC